MYRKSRRAHVPAPRPAHGAPRVGSERASRCASRCSVGGGVVDATHSEASTTTSHMSVLQLGNAMLPREDGHRWKGKYRHRLPGAPCSGCATKTDGGDVSVGIVCVRTCIGDPFRASDYAHWNVEYMVRLVRRGVVYSVVFASFARLTELRAELHVAGVDEATSTPFHLPPSTEQTIENQIAVLTLWLQAQFTCSNPRAESVLAKFLPVPSYLSLVHATASPSPPWITDRWIRCGVRAKPTRLQAAQRRLAFAMIGFVSANSDTDVKANGETNEQAISSQFLDLVCTDLQELIGRSMVGLDYPRTQPTPEACITVVHRRATAMAQSHYGQHRAQKWMISEGAELKRMIDAGLDVNGKTAFLDTPLKAAAAAGDAAAIQLLLDAKATVDDCGDSYNQRTPLMMAAIGAHEAAMHVLLNHGADAALADAGRKTVIDIVSGHPGRFSEKLRTLLGLP